MAKEKKEKVATITNETKAKETALAYLKKTNRPYNCSDIQANMKNTIGKTLLSKVLQDAADKGLIKSKSYGKQMIFCALQDSTPQEGEEDSAKVLEKISKQIEEMNLKITVLTEEVKTKKKELSTITSMPTTADALHEIEELNAQNASLIEKLTSLRSGKDLVDPALQSKVKAAHLKAKMSWQKRKKWFMEAFNAVFENAELKPQALMDLVSAESDEMADVSFKSLL